MTDDQYRELVDFLGGKFERIDARFEQIDARFGQIDARFVLVDRRFDKVDRDVADLRLEMRAGFATVRSEMEAGFATHDRRLAALERRGLGPRG